MSRSGYSDDIDQWDLIRWRGQVASAIRGKRGQSLLKELLAALDAMPEKALVTSEYETPEGEVCTLGALGKARGIEMKGFDPDDYDGWADTFGVAPLVQEVTYLNDEGCYNETPEQRWTRMRNWVARQIRDTPLAAANPNTEQGGERMSEVELMIRGQISTLPADTQKNVQVALERITAVAQETGEEAWIMAIALLGAKMSEVA